MSLIFFRMKILFLFSLGHEFKNSQAYQFLNSNIRNKNNYPELAN